MSDTDDDLPLAVWRARAGRGGAARVDPDVAEGREQVGHDQEEEFHEIPEGGAPEPQPAAGFEAVAEAMARAFRHALNDVQPNREERIPVPTFSGEGDVELFIEQFTTIALVSRWTEVVSILKLRHALRDKAQPCGQGGTTAEIYAELRLRFGMSSAEARSKLSVWKRPTGMPLAEHASKLKQLVKVGYRDVAPVIQRQLVADAFRRSTGHDGLHRHLLAIPGDNVEDLVRAGNAYLQTFGGRAEKTYAVSVDTEVASLGSQPVELADLREVLVSLQKEIKQLKEAQVKSTVVRPKEVKAPVGERKSVKCYGCGQEGHIRRNCPKGQGN
jgi:hypothetical protein